MKFKINKNIQKMFNEFRDWNPLIKWNKKDNKKVKYKILIILFENMKIWKYEKKHTYLTLIKIKINIKIMYNPLKRCQIEFKEELWGT